ncbi:outer membrane protein assembly factor BamB [Streptacidiphilus sp. MAP12-33]|uniref:protein kinase domain-containing protein n=1 Tax=Streptacidiphilus sp. MAP12-33 TaxID=3156266 RepID=UPI0035166E77
MRANDLPSAARIGPYELVRLLGEGGMGQVFLARSPGARLVALKVIRPQFAQEPDFRGRFRREAEAARRVSGLFTPPVLDADADAPLPWLATAYVPAPTLHEVVRAHGPLSAPAVAALGSGLAEALLAIHGAGLVHRDLKPGNVLLADDGPKVIDFGISKPLDGTRLTGTGTTIGTPGFMAPEQVVSGRDTGREADVFALACVLAFAATGDGPFGTDSTAAVLYRIVHEPPRLDGIPLGLRGLLTSCLEKEPARRPSVAGLLAGLGPTDSAALLTPALRADLAERRQRSTLAADAPALPPTVLAPPPVAAPPDRRRFLRVVGAVAATAAVATGAAVWAADRGGAGTTSAGPTPKVGSGTASAPPALATLWRRDLAQSSTSGRIALVGSTLVQFDNQQAAGFDTTTGHPLWTAAPQLPSDSTDQVSWLGASADTLFGGAVNGYLVGLDQNGKQRFVHKVSGPDDSGFAPQVGELFDVAGGVALIRLDLPGYLYRAIDLTDGSHLWDRPTDSNATATTDGQRWYVLDGDAVCALDLRTGRELWKASGITTPGSGIGLSTAAGRVLLTDSQVRALDASTGKQKWAGANGGGAGLSPTVVSGGTAFVADDRGRISALGALDGRDVWHKVSPLDLDTAAARSLAQDIAVSPDLLVLATSGAPGLVALRPVDGQVLWTHQEPASTSTFAWSVLASGRLAFAASQTTLYAFRSPAS